MRRINASRKWQFMCVSALRYALGRKTYIVQDTIDYIAAHATILDEDTLFVMRNDIHNHLAYVEHLSPTQQEPHLPFNNQWKKLDKKLEDRIRTCRHAKRSYVW